MSELWSRLTAFHSKQRNLKALAKNLSYLETERLRREAQMKRLLERALSAMTVLGLIFIGLGLLLHVAGKALNDLIVARVGAYILVIGILLTAMRITLWIAEEIVKRGLKS